MNKNKVINHYFSEQKKSHKLLLCSYHPLINAHRWKEAEWQTGTRVCAMHLLRGRHHGTGVRPCGRIPVSYIQGPISVPGILFPLHPPANVPGDQQTTVQVLKSLSLTWETLALSWPVPAVVAIWGVSQQMQHPSLSPFLQHSAIQRNKLSKRRTYTKNNGPHLKKVYGRKGLRR